jgi:hypothetical protein
MKKMTGLLALFCMAIIGANAQHSPARTATGSVLVTSTLGTAAADYITLKESFDAINAGTHLGDITITITASLAETETCKLNAGAYTSVLIRPRGICSVAALVPSGNALIHLAGADHVTIDGLNDGSNSLKIENYDPSQVTGTSTIRMSADASNNTIDHCTVTGSFSGPANGNGGSILINGGIQTGNDQNVIRNSTIGGRGGGTACAVGIAVTGSQTIENNGLVIENNQITNVFRSASNAAGIFMGSGTSSPLVSGNQIYYTNDRIVYSNSTAIIAGIVFNYSAGRADIINNLIGRSVSGPTTCNFSTPGTLTYRGIYIQASRLTAPFTMVSGNTIAGVTIQTGGNAGHNSICSFSAIDAGSFNSQSINPPSSAADIVGNTIVDMNSTKNLVVTATSIGNTAEVCYINVRLSCSGTVISGNKIGGVFANAYTGMNGIYVWNSVSSPFSTTIQNNIIGGYLPASLWMSEQGSYNCSGIRTDNVVATITNNTVRNYSAQTSSGIYGIRTLSALPTSTINNNTIYNLDNPAPLAGRVLGIYADMPSGAFSITKNSVYALSGAEGNSLFGINLDAGLQSNVKAYNNLIRLGTDSSGNPLGSGNFTGLYETSLGTSSFDHNTVSIAGAGNTSTDTYSTAFWTNAQQGSNAQARNNIFSNSRTNGVLGLSVNSVMQVLPDGVLVSDYNNLVAGGGTFTILSPDTIVAFHTLSSWQLAGHDAHSISVNPQFAGATDLHSLNAALKAGTPIATITTDYANVVRSATAPTMGAYEIGCLPPTISYAGSPFCIATGSGLVTVVGTAGGTFSSTPGLVINATTGAINLATSSSGIYTVTYATTTGCVGTGTTQVTVKPLAPVMNSQPNQTVCAGGSTAAITFTGVPNASYSWTSTNVAIGLAASGAGNIAAFTATNTSSALISSTIRVTATVGTGCAVKTMQLTISVKPLPAVNSVSNQSVCAGTTTSAVLFSGPMAGTVYSWSNNNTLTGLGVAGTGNIAAYVSQNNTGSNQVSTITVTPSVTGCTGQAGIFTLTTQPSVTSITYSAPSYCQAGTASVVRVGSSGGTYQSLPVGLSLNASTGAINLAASTPGIYTVTYTLPAGCVTTASRQVTINAQVFINALSNPVYCNGVITSAVNFTGSAASYSWTNDNLSVGLGASGTGNIAPFTTINAGPGIQYATVRVTPLGNGVTTCNGKVLSFRMTVRYCGPVTQAGDHSGDGNTVRISTGILVSPNPATSQSTITMTESGSYTWQMLNRVGMPVGSPRSFTGTRATIDLSGMTPGSYMLQVVNVRTGVVKQVQVVKF